MPVPLPRAAAEVVVRSQRDKKSANERGQLSETHRLGRVGSRSSTHAKASSAPSSCLSHLSTLLFYASLSDCWKSLTVRFAKSSPRGSRDALAEQGCQLVVLLWVSRAVRMSKKGPSVSPEPRAQSAEPRLSHLNSTCFWFRCSWQRVRGPLVLACSGLS